MAEMIAGGRNMAAWKQKVNRWERRGVRPEIDAQYALAQNLGIPRSIVDQHPWPGWLCMATGSDPYLDLPWTAESARTTLVGALSAYTDRRGFLTLTGAAALAHVAPAWAEPWRLAPQEKIADAVQGGRVDAEVLKAIKRRLVELWTLDDVIGGYRCAELANADLRLVTDMLKRGSHSESVETQLYTLAAGLCRSAGWGMFDADRHAAAERYWRAGLRAAHQGKTPDEAAYLLSNMALQFNFARDGKSAIDALDGARKIIGHDGSRAVHAMLDAWQVRSHAVLQEPEAATRTLGRADEYWDRRDPHRDPDWIYWMRRPSETIEANMAMVEVKRTGSTETHLLRWIDVDGARYSRDRAFALTVIACAQLTEGDLDKALATGRAAVHALRGVESGRIADELGKFTRRLPRNEPRTKRFLDEINDAEAEG
ncbi:hypothetical protein [Spirillospora sp. CA-294931]|uniref:hypothetical protein n=1 Tax=Spirillospora sp. CA-294931 TaxID=3240042 RepID=UPI003D931997